MARHVELRTQLEQPQHFLSGSARNVLHAKTDPQGATVECLASELKHDRQL